MQISIIDVGQPTTHTAKTGRSYQSIEVTYKNAQGQAQSKKLMSFANPDVFKATQDWSKGDVIEVATQKDAKGYWQWTGIGADAVATAEASSPVPATKTATRVTGSNYETKEERAARQVMIVRQSSISSAINALSVGADSAPTASKVIKLAKEFESYVLDKGSEDINDDVLM